MTPVVKDFESIVASMRTNTKLPDVPYYEYGHRLEIANLLTERDKTEFKFKKYPLIALRQPFDEVIADGMVKVKLNFVIVTMTDVKYTTRQRYDKVIIPVLYPLFESFIQAIKNSGLYFWNSDAMDYPPMDKIDWPFWGVQYQEGVEKNIFNDPLDAIELVNVELHKNINC